MKNRYDALVREIRRGKKFLIGTHIHPDGDALGSALALAQGLKHLRKKVKVYNRDPVPVFLRYLPGSSNVTAKLSEDETYDASFLVDCANPDRVGEAFEKHRGRGKLIVLDHHVQSRKAGDLSVIETKAASSGVVVLNLLGRLKVPLTRAVATNIYTTLVTDTGNFRYSNTDAGVLSLGAKLLETGFSPWLISKNLYESFPASRIRLLAFVLPTLEISHGGAVASIALTQAMLRESGATPDLAEEFINFPRSIDTVEVAVQFRELDDGTCKVSFRSKDRVDVAKLAARFGGGGHKRAAGCTVPGSFPAVKEKILEEIRGALE